MELRVPHEERGGRARGDYPFRCFLVVGTAKDCEATLVALHKEFANQ